VEIINDKLYKYPTHYKMMKERDKFGRFKKGHTHRKIDAQIIKELKGGIKIWQ